jgi:cyclase
MSTSAQGDPTRGRAGDFGRVEEISEGIYAYIQPDGTWWINNTAFLVGRRGVAAIEVVEGLRSYAATTLVPGHGPVAGPGLIDEVLAHLHFVRDLAARAKSAGLDPLEAARAADLGEFASLTDPERLVGNLHRAYLELDGLPRGIPLPDPAAVLADMVAFNGGRPLSCHA